VPYIVRPRRFPSKALAACTALMLFGAAQAQAKPAAIDTSNCEEPLFTQPFAYANDHHDYVLAPGQSEEEFEGQGWTLSGGAQIVKDTLPDGSSGSLLDLPSGASAVSPVICVTSAYPKARMLVRNVSGGDSVNFGVGYAGTKSWEAPRNGGSVKGRDSEWTLSAPVNMSPQHTEGWQLVQITLTAKGNKSDLQIDNLYIDPYRR
jgi:hypothetical protein